MTANVVLADSWIPSISDCSLGLHHANVYNTT